ncbi:MAG: phosphoribosylamine--glycine ligase, partial [Actinomycetota bacterium]|nr:phosphoribosylamine--glycine ligase [Actinomycetota bacterium]
VITGLDAAGAMPEVKVFHAGTRRGEGGEMLVAGGRVLSVTGFAQSMPDALTRAYAAIAEIHFEGAQFRSDIGASALAGRHPTERS